MARKSGLLRRDLTVLIAFLLLFAWHGQQGRPLAAAETAAPVQQPLREPQIPEYELVLAHRKEEAIDRSGRMLAWESQEAAHELTAAQQERARHEQALRGEQLEQVADLVPAEYRQLVLDLSLQHGVEPRIVAAVGTVESRWNPHTLGAHGDTGLMQILPSTAEWIASRLGWSEYDLWDPRTNLTMGIWYLSALHREYGSWDQALAAYNGGPRGARLGADHPYVGRVRRVYGQTGW